MAEVVHFKAMMLLLHQQRYEEAVRQLATHLAVFGRIPGDGGRLKFSRLSISWQSMAQLALLVVEMRGTGLQWLPVSA